ncbi:hypothetical protein [Glaciihabitans sp. dw_435]|uniref:hypothetical protein n=1 Tax=Glaciihabitans sp. dw_435 TaxID=2720081 RepID=UPI001BD3AF7F|nr:hypothetical protein [Glaciihabitans sp. dw_435]
MAIFRRKSTRSAPAAEAPAAPPIVGGFHSTVFFPDGAIIFDGRVGVADASLVGVGAQGKIHETFTIGTDEYTLDATARGGRVILSIWTAGKIVTSAAVVSGAEPDDDADILDVFLTSTLATDLVKHLTAGVDAAFAELHTTTQRPFCATVLIPLSTNEQTEAVLDWQNRWVGAHLDAMLAQP